MFFPALGIVSAFNVNHSCGDVVVFNYGFSFYLSDES